MLLLHRFHILYEALNRRVVKKTVHLSEVVDIFQDKVRFVIHALHIGDTMVLLSALIGGPSRCVLTVAVRWHRALQSSVEKAHRLMIRLYDTNKRCGTHVPYGSPCVHSGRVREGIPAGQAQALQVVREITVVIIGIDAVVAELGLLDPSAHPFSEGVRQSEILLPRGSMNGRQSRVVARTPAILAVLIHGEDMIPRAPRHHKSMVELSLAGKRETDLV
mmetsp:Transcript_20943/g.39359  ORF Transcript_20943/g.39359 Transcript_20943/m.39359 type:complete len:219 (-) Transcript_20943:324-980(-)